MPENLWLRWAILPVGNKFPRKVRLKGHNKTDNFTMVRNRQRNLAAYCPDYRARNPTYAEIEDGQWMSESEYGTIRRIAGNGTARGVFEAAIRFCEQRIQHLRIDTHKDNKIMCYLIEKHGFSRRGISMWQMEALESGLKN